MSRSSMPNRFFALILLAVAGTSNAQDATGAPRTEEARLELASLFTDHMVVQRDVAIPVWGWTDPRAEVTVTLGEKSAQTKADSDGRFLVRVPRVGAGGPFELVVQAGKKLTLHDVMVGEVWLGSGQSNMEMHVDRALDFAAEKSRAAIPGLRMFTVARRVASEPQTKCGGTWQVCRPETVGGFSATAYFFARRVHEDLGVPVGVIHSSWGGTAIESWTSMEAQQGIDELAPVFAAWEKERASWDPAAAARRHAEAIAKYEEQARAAKAAKKRAPRRPQAPTDPALRSNHPANLYCGMIAPLIPYAIRGVIWYQGEQNAANLASARRYRTQLPILIGDWRSRWGEGSFPFLFVQLPNFKKRVDDPGAASAWALMRESMLATLAVPNTGMAITIDVGEAGDIHPRDKQSVGDRLARWALAKVYGRKAVVASGPLVAGTECDGSKVIVRYHHADGLKVRGGGTLKGFALAGADRKFRWANATIDGDRVVVSHPDIEHPMSMRYAWGDNPDCNLVNGADLPASPFRTDDWH